MPEDLIQGYFKKKIYTATMGADMQTIPARHGTATFVPAGSTIKIVNSSGTQVIDTWAFALPTPPTPKQKDGEQQQQANGKPVEEETPAKAEEAKDETPKPTSTPKRTKSKKGDMHLPSQEEAEAATSKGVQEGGNESTPQKKGWSSYIPSLSIGSAKSESEKATVKQNSRSWGQYFSAGQGITNYIPNKSSFSSFAKSHYRDPNKPIVQQITDFSRTPVGAAGMSALSGSGYASSLYAGYSAWQSGGQDMPPTMEFLSLPHTRTATLHLVPRVGDTLVSNLREPMLTLVEDTAAHHDTLIAACDPARYQQLGVDKWEEHGSCAENLVLALKELNERAGLKGPKGIGADVTVNSVPTPLNLFMNVPWGNDGGVSMDGPKGKSGEFVRFKAERDVVVVMSACPQDVVGINAGKIQDGQFVVEEELEEGEEVRQRLQNVNAAAQKRPVPQKRTSGAPKVNGATKKPAASATGAAAKPKTPIGTVKKQRTPIGQQKAPPSSSGTTPAATPAKKPSAPSSAAPTRKASTSTVQSTAKPAANASSGPASSANTGAAAAAPPAERKKPRKLTRKGEAPKPTAS